MKIFRIRLVAAVLLVACSLMALAATSSFASAAKPKKVEAFEASPGYEKMDLRLREAWRENPTSKQSAECILKARDRISEDDNAALAAAGFKTRTLIGSIATGSLSMRDVPDVANLPFVQVMELAVPMSLKKP
jgi:hypothetical protein